MRTLAFHRCGMCRDGLADPLVRSGIIEVRNVGAQHAAQVRLAQDEDVVEALAPHAAEEPRGFRWVVQ
jgi:hypothetical protein